MYWKLTVLGSSSALPTVERMLSAQVLETGQESFLFDCGEGTQFQMKKFRIKISKINHIFITHLHGDHFFGLFGLLNTYAMHHRIKDLHIYSPIGLKEILNKMLNSVLHDVDYKIHFHIIGNESTSIIFENDILKINAIPIKHSLPTYGFLVNQKPVKLNIKKELITKLKLTIDQIKKIKQGEDLELNDGVIIPNNELTLNTKVPKSFAYITDTAYFPELVSEIHDVMILYHEATFSNEHSEEAEKKLHSTSSQAALIAKDCGAKTLLIGHFSTRYKSLDKLILEAKVIFNNTVPVYDGMQIQF